MMRKPLDTYAQAAVNLYGIIRLDEFVGIFNSQNTDQTTPDEVYALLLPNVLKSGWYGFYKDYIVHYEVLFDFDWVNYLEEEQSGKPRYIPPKERFLLFERESYTDNDNWFRLHKFMWDAFGYSGRISNAFAEIRDHLTDNDFIKGFGGILDKYNLAFENDKQVQQFLDLIMSVKNNTRTWENKGHTPEEMAGLLANRRPN